MGQPDGTAAVVANPTGIGASMRRKEDLRFLTGRGNYVADISRPDMAAGVFLRSPHAHARIVSIDKAAALAMPGVIDVLTGEDLKADGVGGLPCAWPVTGKNGTPTKEPAILQSRRARCATWAMPWPSSSRKPCSRRTARLRRSW